MFSVLNDTGTMATKRNLKALNNLRIILPDEGNTVCDDANPVPATAPARTSYPSINHGQRGMSQRRSEGRLANIITDIAMSQSLVQLLRDPTVFNFSRLRNKLKSDDRRWMSGFLKHGGLEMLFEGLRSFGSYSGNFSNLVQRLECVMCIKTVMNSQLGMQTITTSREFGGSFASGLFINVVG